MCAADREAAAARRARAVVRVETFLAKFADRIVQLQKRNLRDVVMSNDANQFARMEAGDAKQFAEWKQAQTFLVRHSDFLTVGQKDLLEDWEFILCNMSSLEAVAFLPRL